MTNYLNDFQKLVNNLKSGEELNILGFKVYIDESYNHHTGEEEEFYNVVQPSGETAMYDSPNPSGVVSHIVDCINTEEETR
jgi:hypothetical protein